VNPDTIGYVWTGEYDLNTLRVDGEISESATKKLRIRKYPYTCGQGLSIYLKIIFSVPLRTCKLQEMVETNFYHNKPKK